MGKKIISYSLWGNEPMYTIGAIRNAELAKEIYPDWICRFYLGGDVSEDIVNSLNSFDNTEVIIMTHKKNDWLGMFWRFYAINNHDDVDYIIFRDTDSRLTMREFEAVFEWVQSGKCLHIMRDHPYHSEAIMGGMWGSRPKELMNIVNRDLYVAGGLLPVINMEILIKDWISLEMEKTKKEYYNCIKEEDYNAKGIDQKFLRYVVYKMAWQEAHIQDSFPAYNCWSGRFDYQPHPEFKEMNTGFPTLRGKDWNNFVGQVYDENEIPNEEYADLIRQRDFKIYEDWNES